MSPSLHVSAVGQVSCPRCAPLCRRDVTRKAATTEVLTVGDIDVDVFVGNGTKFLYASAKPFHFEINTLLLKQTNKTNKQNKQTKTLAPQ